MLNNKKIVVVMPAYNADEILSAQRVFIITEFGQMVKGL